MILAPRHRLDACISHARDACVWHAHVSWQIHASKFLLRPAALAIEYMRDIELFKYVSYDWGIIDVVHVHMNLNTCLVQFIVCLNRTESIRDRSHTFVIGNAAQVQRR